MPTDPALPAAARAARPGGVPSTAAADRDRRRPRGPRSRQRGVAHWATTGGSAAPPIYRRARDVARCASGSTGDGSTSGGATTGSCRPTTRPSNVLPLEQILLATGGDEAASGVRTPTHAGTGSASCIHADHLHPMPIAEAIAHGTGTEGAAAAYADELETLVPRGADGVPVFDVYVLGVGAGRAPAVGVPGLGGLGLAGARRRRPGADPRRAARRAGDDAPAGDRRGTAGAAW